MSSSRRLAGYQHKTGARTVYIGLPMTGRRDKVEESVNTVISETRITLDAGFFGENVIILAFEVTNNLGEASDGSQ